MLKKTLGTIVISLILIIPGCTGKDAGQMEQENNNSKRPVAVRIETPRIMTLEQRISYIGTIYARQEIPIIARVQGTLAEIRFREGEAFPANAVLARLDSPELEAAVEKLETEVDYWSRRNETDKRLVEKGALAQEQSDASERAIRSARAGLDEAKAQLAKTVLTAPFEGTVLEWPTEIGQPVMPGQPLILIGDSSREIRVEVVEEDLARGIKAGTPVELLLTAGKPVTAGVSAIAPVSSGKGRTFSVTIPIPNESGGGLQRKGTSIRTEFIVDRQSNVVAVPTRAIADRDGKPHLFIITGDTAHHIEVKLGISREGWIAADFDWNGKDPVAVTNLNSLKTGAPVYAVMTEGSK
ncbi:MAG: efflux RND transporter periplasmic adaptor subunit [Spirochaetales bacterium]|mgnify:CR=1 FL=1|nr:efflux RND transporter periplasmic adaptor subunit [Spirochaetales bacterium]